MTCVVACPDCRRPMSVADGETGICETCGHAVPIYECAACGGWFAEADMATAPLGTPKWCPACAPAEVMGGAR